MFDIPQPRLLLNDCECARLVWGVTCVCPQYDHPNYRPDKMYCIVLVSKLTEPCPAQPGSLLAPLLTFVIGVQRPLSRQEPDCNP